MARLCLAIKLLRVVTLVYEKEKGFLFCNSFLLQIDRSYFIFDLRVLLIKITAWEPKKPFHWVLVYDHGKR